MDVEKTDLIDRARSIDINIRSHGMKRYDVSDIRKLSIISKKNVLSKLVRRTLLIIENFIPIALRKILKVEKTFFPTTFTHLAEAYFLAEKNNIDFGKGKISVDIIEEAIKIYLKKIDDNYYWTFDKNYEYIDIMKLDKVPTMPMHSLARMNIMLLKLGKYYNNAIYTDIAYKSALYTIKNHQVTEYEDGIMSISYFYNSRDCTINVNTEFAQWLSMIPTNLRTSNMNRLISGIVKLVIKEQNDNGSWYYFSKGHMERWGDKPSIDCHHTGTVLNNLINILGSNLLEKDLESKLEKAINKGMKYYVNNFFNSKTGKAKTLIGYTRPAGPVQYSEAVFAFCEYLTFKQFDDNILKFQVKELLPKVVNQLVFLVNIKNGSVPSEKVIRWININSIRWGNGPVLQAIMNYLSIYDDVYRKNCLTSAKI